MKGAPNRSADYAYDVFISYRGAGNAQRWVDEHFAPTLSDCLAYELKSTPRVFFDNQLEQGASWPLELGQKLARSRMLISLWSKNYLESEWCTMELVHMLARETDVGFRTPKKPQGLVAICVIHDGEDIPPRLQEIQSFQVRDYFNTRMRKDSDDAAKLEAALRTKAAELARIIEGAPPFHPSWAYKAAKRFYAKFKAKLPPSQRNRVSFTGG